MEGQAAASSERTSLKKWDLARPEGGDGVSKVDIWGREMHHTSFSQLSKGLSASVFQAARALAFGPLSEFCKVLVISLLLCDVGD